MPASEATGVYAIVNALKGGARVIQALSSGDNTITPPPTADFVIIELDSLSTVVINLQQTALDVGIKLSRLAPTVVTADFLTTTTFNLESVGATSNVWLTYGRLH
jgi:hypothetical protein